MIRLIRNPRGPSLLADDLTRVDRESRFDLKAAVQLGFDAGHPQGLCALGDRYGLSTVDVKGERGYFIVFGPAGDLIHRIDVTDGPRYHPGGCDVMGDTVTLAIAEYRPRSTTVVCALHIADLSLDQRFRVDDHLGAVVLLFDGTYLGVTWGGRDIVRFSADGREIDRRPNSNHFFDVQDLQVVDSESVFCSGLGTVGTSNGPAIIGGMGLISLESLSIMWQVPVAAYSRTGRVITTNAVHVDRTDQVIELTSVPDDGFAQLLVHGTS